MDFRENFLAKLAGLGGRHSPNSVSVRLALPARPKLLNEGGDRSGKDNFKFFFGGKSLIQLCVI